MGSKKEKEYCRVCECLDCGSMNTPSSCKYGIEGKIRGIYFAEYYIIWAHTKILEVDKFGRSPQKHYPEPGIRKMGRTGIGKLWIEVGEAAGMILV